MAPDSPVSGPSNASSRVDGSRSSDSDSSELGRRRRPAILLLGHGSHINGTSSDSVHELARKLRATGRHPEVRVAFWKEEPQLRHAFLLVESREVVAVPFFSSEGYFTDRVLPRELGIEPPVSEVSRVARPGEGTGREGSGAYGSDREGAVREGRESGLPIPGGGGSSAPPDSRIEALDDPIRVHYTRAVGAHPAMADAVLERARDRLREEGLQSGEGSSAKGTTLVILGHGTERHPDSGNVVERLSEELARTSDFSTVTCCFLDQEPRMLPVLEAVDTEWAVVVPFFMAEGWHVRQTIPRDLELEAGQSRVGDTGVYYTDPVGTHPAMVQVVEEMVAEVLGDEEARNAGPSTVSRPPPTLPTRARRAFLAWIDEAGEIGRAFLETRARRTDRIRGTDGDRRSGATYEIRHEADADVSAGELERRSDPGWARLVAARTAEGEHRPLKTAPNLRRGWILGDLTSRDVWEAYTHLYPAAAVHWYLGREGILPVIPFRETADRQTGIYEIVADLEVVDVVAIRSETCRKACLRRVRWPLDGRGGVADPSTGSGVLCPEACSLFVTVARERAQEKRAQEERAQQREGGSA